MSNKQKVILDLCGGTGAWSKPYKEAGYEVIVLTLPKYDVTKWKEKEYHWLRELIYENKIWGILAAPPCTMFSFARTKAKELRDLKEGMEIVRACLDIIWYCMEGRQETKYKTVPLRFWALENPNGMLKFFLGKPAFEFNPYDFGDNYKKNTHIWGWFNEPNKTPVKCDNVKFDKMSSKDIHPERFGELTRQERRAITPMGFAKSFFEVNK